jgi:hypothetical protein
MEAYLEVIDVEVLRAVTQGFTKPKDPATLLVMRLIMRSGMQRPKTPSLEAFIRTYPKLQRFPCSMVGYLCAP